MKTDEYMFNCALRAARSSHDPDRKVGAALFSSGHRLVSLGANRLPSNIRHDSERLSRTDGSKYFWIEHAERLAIFRAVKLGKSSNGSILASTYFPCADCARAIIASGVTKIICPKPDKDSTTHYRSMKIAEEMLKESLVEIIFV